MSQIPGIPLLFLSRFQSQSVSCFSRKFDRIVSEVFDIPHLTVSDLLYQSVRENNLFFDLCRSLIQALFSEPIWTDVAYVFAFTFALI